MLPILKPKRIIQNGLVAHYAPIKQRNLLKWSEDFSSDAWGKSNLISYELNQIDAFGGNTAIKITTNDTAPMFQLIALPIETRLSVYLRADTPHKVTVGGASGGRHTLDVTSEWKRYSVPQNNPLSAIGFLGGEYGVVGDSVYICFPQLELGNSSSTYQKANDLQQLLDYGRYGYHGQLGSTNGVDSTDPIYRIGLKYDGLDDYVIVGNISKEMKTCQIAFYNTNTIDKSTAGQCLINFEGDANGIVLGAITGTFADEIITILNTSNRTAWKGNDSISIGWHLLDIVWNGISYDIILDTNTKSTISSSTPMILPVTNLQLGRLAGNSNYFNGEHSHILLYERSLTRAELANNRSVVKQELKMKGVDALW